MLVRGFTVWESKVGGGRKPVTQKGLNSFKKKA